MKGTVLDAGTAVIVLVFLFLLLLALGVFLTLIGQEDNPLTSKILEWAGAAFFAVLAVLGIQRGRRNGRDDE